MGTRNPATASRSIPLSGVLLRFGGLVFVIEILSHFIMAWTPARTDGRPWIDALLDASILTILVVVVLQRWIIQPLGRQLSQMIGQLNQAKLTAEQLARTDSLTGLLNRRAFFDDYHKEWTRSERTKRPFSVLMIDVDFFKMVNDSYGHLTGDYVLRNIAAVLQNTCRSYDRICRFGGDEFCVLLMECALSDAVTIAERFRGMIAEMEMSYAGQSFSATVSIGVAEYHSLTSDSVALMESADQALLKAKRLGRNRVEIPFRFQVSAENVPCEVLVLA